MIAKSPSGINPFPRPRTAVPLQGLTRMDLYEHEDSLYLNITNRCPVACSFCVKSEWGYSFHGQDLKLGAQEPSAADLCARLDARLKDRPPYREIVFCGFGEPTMRADVLNEVGRHLRRNWPDLRLRLNTVGLGNMINGRDIVPDLAVWLDAVSISLNTADPVQWEALHRPQAAYKGRGFAAVLLFAQRCVECGIETRVTAVDQPGVDLKAVGDAARAVGAAFHARPALV